MPNNPKHPNIETTYTGLETLKKLFMAAVENSDDATKIKIAKTLGNHYGVFKNDSKDKQGAKRS